eukprot:2468392-Lingulodinium_polyedra.AAC.1
MVSNAIPKAVRRIHRKKAEPFFLQVVKDSLHGGIPKRGTDMATHKLRLWLRVAVAQRGVAGVVFFDAIAAFYS